MKLSTFTLKMARPSPQAAEPSAAARMRAEAVVFITGSLVERDGRGHRDATLVGERIAVRPEPQVQTERSESHAPAPPELHFLALVARHAAPDGEGPEPLLPADVDHGPAPVVHHVAADRRSRTHAKHGIGDVGHGDLRRGFDAARDERVAYGVRRGVVIHRLDLRVLPRQLRADVVRAEADFEGTRDEHDADVATEAASERPLGVVVAVREG